MSPTMEEEPVAQYHTAYVYTRPLINERDGLRN